MKKLLSIIFFCACLSVIAFNFSSCGKEKSIPPDVSFIVADGYVYEDTALAHGTAFTIWVNASKTQTDGLLAGAKIYHSVNGSPDSLIQEMSFTTQYFSQTYSYMAGDSGNVERYRFEVSKRDGQTNSASVTITDF